MQVSGVKIGIVGPDQGTDFGIQSDLVEHTQVTKRTINLASQNGFKVDGLFGIVIELNAQRIRSDNLECRDMLRLTAPQALFYFPLDISHAERVMLGTGQFSSIKI
jgi:hypothetical protein